MSTIVILLLGKLIGISLMKLLGERDAAKALDLAGGILGDANNPITDVRKAAEQAVIAMRQKQIDAMAAELERQRQLGELAIRAAEQRGRDNALPDVTIVPPDGTEEFKSPWADKNKP